MIAMLIPLYLLGQPAGGGTGDPGGQLTQMRTEYNIAESELGDINPASETMKLASLGLRGVAATLLWSKANDYKVHHEWDRLKATLNNIALLQPHYEKVWEFQAHNLSYNVSTEFDDYRQRYAMVREGIDYLTRGVEQNRKAPRLVWYTGWFYGQKLGMSDEKRQFRRLFSDDDPQHDALREQNIAIDSPEARGPDGRPDNWLVGRQWLNYGYDLVDSGVKIRNQTPINFYETGPKWRIKHSEAIESEGILDDRAKAAWQLASDDWLSLGQRSIPTTAPFTIKLGSLDELDRRYTELLDKFMEIAGDTYLAEEQAIFNSLTEEERLAVQTPAEDRDDKQVLLYGDVYSKLKPSLSVVAKKAPGPVRLRAIELSTEIADIDARRAKTKGQREQINYDFWMTLTIAEQEDRTVQARRLRFEAEQANADADLDLAIQKYEEAFKLWAEVFDDYPVLLQDEVSDDLMKSIRRYTIAIDRDSFPDDFPLLAFVEYMQEENRLPEDYQRIREEQAKRAQAASDAKAEADAVPPLEPGSDSEMAGEAEAESPEPAESAEPAEADADSEATAEPAADEQPGEETDGEPENSADEVVPDGGEGTETPAVEQPNSPESEPSPTPSID
jgi:hypothetical protein